LALLFGKQQYHCPTLFSRDLHQRRLLSTISFVDLQRCRGVVVWDQGLPKCGGISLIHLLLAINIVGIDGRDLWDGSGAYPPLPVMWNLGKLAVGVGDCACEDGGCRTRDDNDMKMW
jgi:hypothetical protein